LGSSRVTFAIVISPSTTRRASLRAGLARMLQQAAEQHRSAVCQLFFSKRLRRWTWVSSLVGIYYSYIQSRKKLALVGRHCDCVLLFNLSPRNAKIRFLEECPRSRAASTEKGGMTSPARSRQASVNIVHFYLGFRFPCSPIRICSPLPLFAV
jgi:hypothetical protein